VNESSEVLLNRGPITDGSRCILRRRDALVFAKRHMVLTVGRRQAGEGEASTEENASTDQGGRSAFVSATPEAGAESSQRSPAGLRYRLGTQDRSELILLPGRDNPGRASARNPPESRIFSPFSAP